MLWNRRLVGYAENPGIGAMEGPWGAGAVQCSAVQRGLGLAELPNSNGQDRCSCPSLPTKFVSCSQVRRREEAVKQRMIDGQYVQCSLKDEAAQSSQAALTLRPWPGLEVPIANSDYRCSFRCWASVGVMCVPVCLSAVLPVRPARGRICMNQGQKLIDELFFLSCLLLQHLRSLARTTSVWNPRIQALKF